MDLNDSPLEYLATELRLEIEQFCINNQYAADLLRNGDLKVYAEHYTDSVIARFRKMIPAEKTHESKVELRAIFPASVWQHFKRDYLPRWFLRRFPVRYVEICEGYAFTQLEAYPKLPEFHAFPPEALEDRFTIIKTMQTNRKITNYTAAW